MPDREKVIEFLIDLKERLKWQADIKGYGHYIETIDDALALLKEQEERWIPVTERLPEDDTDILAYCTDGEESRIDAVNYANGVWYDCIFNAEMAVENITHWMPLPDPPKEGR